MKMIILVVASVCIVAAADAQLKTTPVCNTFIVDILAGKVNDVQPDFLPARIKKELPCFTGEEPAGTSSKCGAGVFYKDKDVYFFTDRKYVEIREKFTGKLTVPLMGASRNSLFKLLGNPKIKDVNWDAFEMQYGTLVLHYNKAGKVNLVQFSRLSTDGLTLCE
jgi:hypothetical protein